MNGNPQNFSKRTLIEIKEGKSNVGQQRYLRMDQVTCEAARKR
jgi:hypothetical protein